MLLADVRWSTGVENAWSSVATFIPKAIGFLAILIIGWFVAKAVGKIADRVLERIGFDRWVERGGVKRALSRSQYDASDIVGKIIFYALFLMVLQLAFGLFGPNPISDLIRGVVAYLPKVFAAILIVVVAMAIAAAARELISASLGGLSYGETLANVAAVAIGAVGVFAALNQLQIAPAIVNGLFYALLAIVAGSAIIAIGGGGIRPMQRRWESVLQRWDEEKPRIQGQLSTADGRVRQRAQEIRGQAQGDVSSTQTVPTVTTTGGATRTPPPGSSLPEPGTY